MLDFITVNTHSSIRLAGDIVIYVDPYKIEDAPHDADLILITHPHYDHFSSEDIAKVRKADTEFVAPRSMEQLLWDADISDMILLSPNERVRAKGIMIEGVPAYNLLRTFHPKQNGWLGYVISIQGMRVYIAGDTDATDEAKKVKCDVAIIPIGGTYTMNVREAVNYTNLLQPKYAIPVHYGTIIGGPVDGETYKELVGFGVQVVIKIKH